MSTEDPNVKFTSELNDIMFALRQKYSPVTTIKEADICLSTSEFLSRIQDHYPSAIDLGESQMYELLKYSGYTFAAVGTDAKLQWLVKLM